MLNKISFHLFNFQASFESEFSKNKGKVTGFVSLCKEIFSRFITQHFPIMIESQVSTFTFT